MSTLLIKARRLRSALEPHELPSQTIEVQLKIADQVLGNAYYSPMHQMRVIVDEPILLKDGIDGEELHVEVYHFAVYDDLEKLQINGGYAVWQPFLNESNPGRLKLIWKVRPSEMLDDDFTMRQAHGVRA